MRIKNIVVEAGPAVNYYITFHSEEKCWGTLSGMGNQNLICLFFFVPVRKTF